MRRFSIKRITFWTILIFIIIVLLDYSSILNPVEHKLYDLQMILRAFRGTGEQEVIVVAVDEGTLDRLGPWPLKRSIYARLLNYLQQKGVEAVGVDMLFADPFLPEDDAHLRNVLASFSGAVLAEVLHLKKIQGLGWEKLILEEREGAHPFLISGIQQGYINLFPDEDGIIRRGIVELECNGKRYSSLPLKLMELVDEKSGQKNNLPGSFYIDYRPLYSIPVLSLADVLAEKYPEDFFRGKVVILGATARSLEDYVATPLARLGLQPGVLVHATILSNLLQKQYIHQNPWLNLALLLAGIFIFALFYFRHAPSRRWLWSLFLMILIMISGVLIFVYAGFWVKWGRLLIAVLILLGISSIMHFKQEQGRTERLRGLFSRYVSGELLDEILGYSEDEDFLASRREVTVVFIDIRGFTAYSASREPEEILEVVNKYMQIMVTAVFKHHGMVNKFLGDGMMAIFGAPVARQKHADHALKAALLIMQNIVKSNLPLSLGIGINSGEVIAGNVGTRDRLEYTVMGEAVNTAARLCERALPGEILIGEETFNYLQEREKLPLTPVEKAGLSSREKVYSLVEERRDFDAGH